ncbi:hypothetical protein BGZ51_005270 [Haplosporangium sp. Z 767]|nr:hypothetical protein BGZ51_005270 [Haplosporangium sp. Z 767]
MPPEEPEADFEHATMTRASPFSLSSSSSSAYTSLDFSRIRSRIAQYLSFKDCLSCALVCKDWHNDFVAPLWHTLNFETQAAFTQLPPAVIAKHGHLFIQIRNPSTIEHIQSLQHASIRSLKVLHITLLQDNPIFNALCYDLVRRNNTSLIDLHLTAPGVAVAERRASSVFYVPVNDLMLYTPSLQVYNSPTSSLRKLSLDNICLSREAFSAMLQASPELEVLALDQVIIFAHGHINLFKHGNIRHIRATLAQVWAPDASQRSPSLLVHFPRLQSWQMLPAPAEEAPAPTEETPAPAEETPAPAEEAPAPAEETPAPTEEAPAPAEKAPAPTEEAPAPTEEAPAPAEEASAPAEEAPAPAEETPAPAEETPESDAVEMEHAPETLMKQVRDELKSCCPHFQRVDFDTTDSGSVSKLLSGIFYNLWSIKFCEPEETLQMNVLTSILVHNDTLRSLVITPAIQADKEKEPAYQQQANDRAILLVPRICRKLQVLSFESVVMDMDLIEDHEWACKDLRELRLKIKGLESPAEIDGCLEQFVALRGALRRRGGRHTKGPPQVSLLKTPFLSSAPNVRVLDGGSRAKDEDELGRESKSISERVLRHLLSFKKLTTVWLGTKDYHVAV